MVQSEIQADLPALWESSSNVPAFQKYDNGLKCHSVTFQTWHQTAANFPSSAAEMQPHELKIIHNTLTAASS
jgi:hypothetical protein